MRSIANLRNQRKMNEGITLIALVITIIVLLILAAVSIVTLTGENGILTKAGDAKDKTTLESYLEEIKLEIMDEQVERKYQTKEDVFIKSIDNRLQLKSWVRETYMCDENFEEQQEIEKNTVLIINTVENYQIIIDVDNTKISATIRESFIISGKMATIEYNANGATSGTVENQEIKVGSIFSFADNAYVREDHTFIGWCEDSSGNGRIYKPKEKIIVTKEKITLYAIWFNGTSTSLLKGIEMLDNEGYYQLKVNEVTYNLHMYYYEGDQTWNENKTFGDENDVGAENRKATNMVVVKVAGNLDIGSGVTVEPYHTDYGGPKGFLVYCTGTLTNKGTIQNNHGAKTEGEDVYLWRNEDTTYEYIPASGASGGEGYPNASGLGNKRSKNGAKGSNANSSTISSGSGVKRATAGRRRWRNSLWNHEW